MNYQEKTDLVLSLIAEIADINQEEIQNESTFEEIGVDSLMALELAVHLEREFGVVINEEELINLRKVEDLFQYLV
ncbi:acyl carrier protein [Bacillus sp. SM2101]|uniref:acyl carrier protein n=1 Tax=Bacillus sp. SM2101 TaxID=2805366 RepID=UPI001BDF5D49|nr:acyl carrier protein [Bacillus sp. SM2101]